jgi:hypothetical protein
MKIVVQSLLDSGGVVILAEILAIALLPVIVFLVGRLFVVEAELAQARERVVDALAEIDQVRSELTLARDRLDQTRQVASRAVERDVPVLASRSAIQPFGEGRCDLVGRKLTEALRRLA